uniref:Renin-1 n=1 Tax=Lygus hesperus TaxID=30085 RepID=A0A0A9YMD8_LYGHE
MNTTFQIIDTHSDGVLDMLSCQPSSTSTNSANDSNTTVQTNLSVGGGSSAGASDESSTNVGAGNTEIPTTPLTPSVIVNLDGVDTHKFPRASVFLWNPSGTHVVVASVQPSKAEMASGDFHRGSQLTDTMVIYSMHGNR